MIRGAAAGALGLCLLACSAVTEARTWLEDVRDEMFCTALATPADRQEFGRIAGSAVEPFAPLASDPTSRLVRHLYVLSGIAYLADTDNDQALRSQLLIEIGVLADRGIDKTSPAVRQVSRCARAWLISSAIEREDYTVSLQMARNLASLVLADPLEPAVSDLPLIHALREISLGTSTDGVRELVAAAYDRAGKLEASAPDRASRLLAAAAIGMQRLGEPKNALDFATRSVRISTAGARPVATWRAFPIMYDVLKSTAGEQSARQLATTLLQKSALPQDFHDGETRFAVFLRLAEVADAGGDYDRSTEYLKQALDGVLSPVPARLSIPSFRRGLTALRSTLDDATMPRDLNWARTTYRDSYRPMYAQLLQRADALFAADERDRIHFAFNVDRTLNALSLLSDRLPESRAEIAALSFRLAQLRSYGRFSAAAALPLTQRVANAAARDDIVARMLKMQARFSSGLRKLWVQFRTLDPTATDRSKANKDAFTSLDIIYNETSLRFRDFRERARQEAPQLASVLSPAPLDPVSIQGQLSGGEALLMSVSTDYGVMLWAVTRGQTTFAHSNATQDQVRELVARIRASVMPHNKGDSIEVAPFDADAAWQLYSATIGPLESQLKGVTDVVWDAVGPHAAVPPAILISKRPTQVRATSAAELSSLPFMTDRFAFTFVPDLPLFSFYRGEHAAARADTRFVGIGAPLLSTEELAGARKSRSMDLAGGYDVRALTDMPKLPDAAAELRELASVFGADRSTLLLGAEASEPAVRKMDFTGARVVAFATHGFVANEIAGVAEPALMLDPPRTPSDTPSADGLLTASELAAFKFDADLVILSACNSATADGRPRADAFSGLAQSFAAAGARALLVSHWPVATGAAADLTVKTVTDSRNAHLSLARSLQKAMQDVRQEGKADPLRAHPFYWAPFALIGDGRTTLQ